MKHLAERSKNFSFILFIHNFCFNYYYYADLKGFPCSSVGKESACSTGDPGSIPGFGWSLGEGHGNPLQHPYLENLMDRGAWWAAVRGVIESRAWVTNT